MNLETVDRLVMVADRYRGLLLALGGVLLVLLVVAGWWARRRGNRGAVYRLAAGAVAVALSAEGMWEVATESLGFAWWKALLLFAFAELAMLNEAHQAKARVKQAREPGVHGAAVWVIAVGAGLIAASNAASTAEYLLRLGAPTLLAWQWWSDLIADRPDRERQASRWIWTPQRIGVRLGLLKPGTVDNLTEVFQQRSIDRMVHLADRTATGWTRLAGRRNLRLRRLAQSATPEMLAEVAKRYRRGLDVRDTIFGQNPDQQSTTDVPMPPVETEPTPDDAPDDGRNIVDGPDDAEKQRTVPPLVLRPVVEARPVPLTELAAIRRVLRSGSVISSGIVRPSAQVNPDTPTPNGVDRPLSSGSVDGRTDGPDDADEVTTAARTVAAELATQGRRVTRDALAAGVRARGVSISTERATVLARELSNPRPVNGHKPAGIAA